MVLDIEQGATRPGTVSESERSASPNKHASVGMTVDVANGKSAQSSNKGLEASSAKGMSVSLSTPDLKNTTTVLPPAPPMQPASLIFTPGDVYRSLQATALARINAEYFTLAAMGLAAGAYVGFGFTFCAMATGTTGVAIIGALCFPIALLLIVMVGGDLFTGNTCSLFTASIEGQANLWHNIKHLVGTYFWNLVGCLLIVGLELGGGVWKGRENYVHSFAHSKMSLSWGECVCRAIMANWLVNLSLWLGASARDMTGKVIGFWIPITCFVTIGLEHCIANMYIIPMSIYLPPTEKYPNTITWASFIRENLVPATIGNWIGGAIMVGFLNACIHGRNIPRWKNMAWDATLGKAIPKLP